MGQVVHRKAESWGTCLGDGETGVPDPVCGAGTTQNCGIVVHPAAFRSCRAGLRGGYYTKRRKFGAPVFVAARLVFWSWGSDRVAETEETGETGEDREPYCRAGTTRNDGTVQYLPRFRACRAGLRGRCYTKQRNFVVPACFSGLRS